MTAWLSQFITYMKPFEPFLSVLAPIIAVLLTGKWLNINLEKVKNKLEHGQSITNKRMELYSEIKDDLNNVYSYIKRVGNWKDQTPDKIIDTKRVLDQKMYTSLPYWTTELFASYTLFMDVCFETNRGHKENAGLRAQKSKYMKLDNWSNRFDDCFVDGFDEAKLDAKYLQLVNSFAKNFGIEHNISISFK